MMGKKKVLIYQLFCYFLILTAATTIGRGCCGNDATTPATTSSNTNARIELQFETPDHLPPVSVDSFIVTGKLLDVTGTYHVHLEVRNRNSICNAYVDTNISVTTSTNATFTKQLFTDSLSSGCLTQNSIMTIAVWFKDDGNNIHRDSVYYLWGNYNTSGEDSIDVDMEQWGMNYASSSSVDTMVKCTTRSLSPHDTNYIKLNLNYSSPHDIGSDRNFTATVGTINNTLYNYSDSLSSNPKIVFSRRMTFYDQNGNYVEVLGWSIPSGVYGKWSYIFKKNIDSIAGSYQALSIANQVSVHEIARQVGGIVQNNSTTSHAGYFTFRCALHDVEFWRYQDEFTHYTGFYRICTDHATMIREFQGHTPLNFKDALYPRKNILNGQLLHSAGQSQQKYDLKMSLAKNTYKKYEPVIARFELINHDSQPMNVYYLFSSLGNEANININSDDNALIKGNKFKLDPSVSYLNPRTTVNPGDTLVAAMSINDWGMDANFITEGKKDNYYFEQNGYFLPGKYEAYFTFSPESEERYNSKLQSNQVSFTVADLDEEDKQNLDLYKQGKFEDALNSFPTNTFAEHILFEKLKTYLLDPSNIKKSDYELFIQKFPNSYHLISGIIKPYIDILTAEKGNNKNAIEYILNNYQSEILKRILNNDGFLKYQSIEK